MFQSGSLVLLFLHVGKHRGHLLFLSVKFKEKLLEGSIIELHGFYVGLGFWSDLLGSRGHCLLWPRGRELLIGQLFHLSGAGTLLRPVHRLPPLHLIIRVDFVE